MAHVLTVSHVPLSDRMTAPGIRYTELARELSVRHEVTLAGPTGSTAGGVRVYDPRRPATLAALMSECDVVFSQPLEPRLMARAARDGRRWIVDLINPEPIEGLEHHRHKHPRLKLWLETVRIDRLTYAAMRGSAFACGNQRQRDMWIGFLAGARRLQSADRADDREMKRLIDVVPSGVPSDPPVAFDEPIFRGRVFPADSRIVLWNGGVWDWLDAAVAVEALVQLRSRDLRWVLLFNGVSHPQGDGAKGIALQAALDAIKAHQLGPDAVHINDRWTPYRQHGAVLMEADVGVSTHPASLEAYFSFRNRILDFLWARLPMVCTAGDEFAREADTCGWGEVVPPADPAALAAAAERVVSAGPHRYQPALDEAAQRYSWASAGQRLLRLIEESPHVPHRFSDGLVAGKLAARHSTAGIARDLVRSCL